MPDGRLWCTLVHPEEDWTHWDPAAEAVHGIARDLLFKHGRSPAEICLALNSELRGQPVHQRVVVELAVAAALTHKIDLRAAVQGAVG